MDKIAIVKSLDSTNFVLPGSRTIEKLGTSAKYAKCTFRKSVFQEKIAKNLTKVCFIKTDTLYIPYARHYTPLLIRRRY